MSHTPQASPTPESATAEIQGSDQGRESLSSASLGKRVGRAYLWTTFGHGAGQLLRLINNLVLWRLLAPDVFGLMALVMACIGGLVMFSDVGIGPSIVQSDHGDDPKYLNTAWTIQVGREFVICLIASLMAWPLSSFYGEPLLAKLLPAVAIGSLFSGFNSTRLFTAARTISLGRLTVIDLLVQIVGLSVMIVGAWLYHSIWAIVAGMTVSNIIRLILSHTILPGIRNRFHWDADCARSMLKFGRWIFLSTALTFFVMQADRLVFGKIIPLALLGVYSIATTWASVSEALASRVFRGVLFPVLSRLNDEQRELSSSFLRIRKPWLLMCGCVAACLVAGGPTLIRLLYDSKADDAGWIIQTLAGGIWLLVLADSNVDALLAMGAPKWIAAGNAAKLIALVVLIPVGFRLFRFPGAVAGIAGSEAAKYLVSLIGTRRHKLAGLAQDIQMSVIVVVTSLIGLSVATWIVPALHASLSSLPARLGTLIEGLAIFVAIAPWWGAIFLRDRSRRQKVAGSV
jgi:O-antigen/teichoic acid export membrane protein